MLGIFWNAFDHLNDRIFPSMFSVCEIYFLNLLPTNKSKMKKLGFKYKVLFDY